MAAGKHVNRIPLESARICGLEFPGGSTTVFGYWRLWFDSSHHFGRMPSGNHYSAWRIGLVGCGRRFGSVSVDSNWNGGVGNEPNCGD